MKKLAVVLVSLLVVACSSTSKTDSSKTSQSNTKDSASVPAATPAIQAQSVYFDFDQSAVTSGYREVVRKQAEFIKGHKTDVVTLEGNCDERGSNEYNLALGERRADQVKKLLRAAGVPAKQVKTVSLGKEKPKLACHEEKCWKEDRRVDFVHSA